MTSVSQDTATSGRIPEWDLADRLAKSLRHSKFGVGDMAEFMGVSRDTISRWVNGHNKPSKAAQIVWASITDVDLHWLETGQAPVEVRPAPEAPLPRLDSNQQPSGYRPSPLRVVKGGLTPNRTVPTRRTRHLKAVS